MNDDVLATVDKRGVATVTLNRPGRHNAFNAEVIARLREVIDALATEETVRAVVVRAAGDSFCSGADLEWMKAAANWSLDENEADAVRLAEMLEALDSCPKPTVALVQGPAYGGGVGLIACADIAIAVTDASFALTEVRLGIFPATISPFMLAAIGARACRRYFQTGERFNAAKALELGLLHEVVGSREDLHEAGERVVRDLLAGGPAAVAGAKRLIVDYAGRPVDLTLRRDSAQRIAQQRTSDEGQEGLAAFLERRKPKWVR